MGVVNYTVVNGELLAENRDNVRRWYVPDPLGSTIALLDNTQTQTDTFTYWPYGEERTRTGTTATPFRFVGTWGYYRDAAGRVYVRARVLDIAKGRWLTVDPTGFESLDINLYRYVTNSPTILADPSGLICSQETPIGYGNYCGPTIPAKNKNKRKKPFPDVDTCCQAHDDCWARHGCNLSNHTTKKWCPTCDANLCSCARKRDCKNTPIGQEIDCKVMLGIIEVFFHCDKLIGKKPQ